MTHSRNVSRRGAETQSAQSKELNEVTGLVIDRSVSIHRDLGPGLLENVYEAILERKLLDAGLEVQRQVAVPLEYEGLRFREGFRVDLMVESKLILEIKAVETIIKAHKRQLLTYLKPTNLQVGLMLNFGAVMMRDGIARVVNDLHE